MRLGHPLARALLRTRHFWVPALLLVALWIPGVNQGWYRTDTHYYAAVAMDALARARAAPSWGESLRALLFLQAAGEPYLNKPPLPFWIHGAAIDLFGLHLWSVRLPSLLAAIGGAWAAAALVARLGSRRLALAAAAILATTIEYFRYTRAISLDLWMTFFMLAALALIARGVAKRRTVPIIWSGVPIGLALMCKPFVALLAPIIVGIWLVRTGRSRLLIPLAISTLIALAVAAPWHIAAAFRFGRVFIQTYIIQQSIDRATTAPTEPWWFYFRIFAETYWPWAITLLLCIIALRHRTLIPNARVRSLLGFATIWCAIWFIVLLAFGGKSPRYLTPIFPLLSVFSAVWLLHVFSGRRGRKLVTLAVTAVVILSLILAIVGARVHAPRHPSWDALLVELDQRPGKTLQATPMEHSISANLVMLGRPWPRTAHDIVVDPPELLLLHRKDSPLGPGWRIISTTREYILAERLSPDPKP